MKITEQYEDLVKTILYRKVVLEMEYWEKHRTMIARIKGGEGIDLFGNKYINFNVAHRNNTKMRRLTLFIFY